LTTGNHPDDSRALSKCLDQSRIAYLYRAILGQVQVQQQGNAIVGGNMPVQLLLLWLQ
jgi:hypothetical protein